MSHNIRTLSVFLLSTLLFLGHSTHAMNSPRTMQLSEQLITSIENNKEREVRLLLFGYHVDPNTLINGKNALHVAVENNLITLVKLLLLNGADVDARAPEYQNSTALGLATYHGYIDMVNVLLAHKADVNATMFKEELTALHTAAQRGFNEIISILINAGAYVDTKSNIGATPLHNAVQFGKVDTVQTLIKLNANINAEMKDGTTPLQIAVICNQLAIAEILIKKYALI